MFKTEIKIDLSGVYVKSARATAALRRFESLTVRCEYGGRRNTAIAKAELSRGGNVFKVGDDAIAGTQNIVRDAFVKIVNHRQNVDPRAAMQQVADLLVMSITDQVLAGNTGGPARTPWWNAFKAANFAPPTPNMVATGEWLATLRAKVVSATRSRNAAARAA